MDDGLQIGLDGQEDLRAWRRLPKNHCLPKNPIIEPAGNLPFSLAQKYVVGASESFESGQAEHAALTCPPAAT